MIVHWIPKKMKKIREIFFTLQNLLAIRVKMIFSSRSMNRRENLYEKQALCKKKICGKVGKTPFEIRTTTKKAENRATIIFQSIWRFLFFKSQIYES